MTIKFNPKYSEWNEILQRPVQDPEQLISVVQPILSRVRTEGDRALYEYEEQFDKVKLSSLQVSQQELDDAAVSRPLRAAIRSASRHIEIFHGVQKNQSRMVRTAPGVCCWQNTVPITSVGLYIPGGTAPLFSSVLMLGIPARLAGCQDIILCTPPDKNGQIDPAILYAAKSIGIHKVYKVGGAQAIAAMAFGTETVPKVSKIFGPGNQYVTTAKQLVTMYGVAIDMPAGPSEVLVLADHTANPAFVAADLLAQAEHGVDSQVVLVTTSYQLIPRVQQEIDMQLKQLPRRAIAEQALENSKLICVETIEEAIIMTNMYAPEHLIIQTECPNDLVKAVVNAGSVFLGHMTPESAGDYASGTNHTLPTNGCAKAYSGVNLDSYMRKITFQEITPKGLKSLASTIEVMAETEQLVAHKNAVSIRLNFL